MRILVIDDVPAIRDGVRRLLVSQGHQVETAESCAAARELQASVDVAIVDLHLGDGMGDELATELLQTGATRRIVFLTGTTERSLLDRAKRLGPVVMKSADTRELIEALAPESEA